MVETPPAPPAMPTKKELPKAKTLSPQQLAEMQEATAQLFKSKFSNDDTPQTSEELFREIFQDGKCSEESGFGVPFEELVAFAKKKFENIELSQPLREIPECEIRDKLEPSLLRKEDVDLKLAGLHKKDDVRKNLPGEYDKKISPLRLTAGQEKKEEIRVQGEKFFKHVYYTDEIGRAHV